MGPPPPIPGKSARGVGVGVGVGIGGSVPSVLGPASVAAGRVTGSHGMRVLRRMTPRPGPIRT